MPEAIEHRIDRRAVNGARFSHVSGDATHRNDGGDAEAPSRRERGPPWFLYQTVDGYETHRTRPPG